MGKPKRNNPYDGEVASTRKLSQSYGETRQTFSGINSSFRNSPLNPEAVTSSSSSSGDTSFPITPTILDLSDTWSGTQTIDLSLSTAHMTKIILDQNLTVAFSNPPASGTQIEFEIEYVQDGTGGFTVTHPASVAETVTISSTAGATTIVTYRTNDNGTTYHAIPALRGTISVNSDLFATKALDNLASVAINTSLISDTDDQDDLGSSGKEWKDLYIDGTANIDTLAATTMSGDITMGNNDILTCKDIQFQNGGSVTNTVAMIVADASGDMLLNVASADNFQMEVGGVDRVVLDVNDFFLDSATSDTNDLNFRLTDTSPQNDDIPGKLQWTGFDDAAGGPFVYASIWGTMEDVSAGTLDGSIRFTCASANNTIDLMTMNFASNTTRVFQSLVPSGAGKSLGLSSLSWADNFMDIINAGGSTDLDLKCDSGQNINMFSNGVSRGFFDDTGFNITTGLHFSAQASDPTASQEMQSNLNNIVMLTEEFKLMETSNSVADFTIWRNDSSPTDDSEVGRINFAGMNDAGTQIQDTYAQIIGVAKDVTSGSEDGSFQVQTLKAGSLQLSFEVRHSTTGVLGYGFGGSISSLFTYVPSNVTTVRSFDANQAFDATQWAVLNDVVATLIVDMQAHGLLL